MLTDSALFLHSLTALKTELSKLGNNLYCYTYYYFKTMSSSTLSIVTNPLQARESQTGASVLFWFVCFQILSQHLLSNKFRIKNQNSRFSLNVPKLWQQAHISERQSWIVTAVTFNKRMLLFNFSKYFLRIYLFFKVFVIHIIYTFLNFHIHT